MTTCFEETANGEVEKFDTAEHLFTALDKIEEDARNSDN